MPHLEFYPHEPKGVNVHALFQSLKWMEELSEDLRVQMAPHGRKHYYIFEPVTLKTPDQAIVIPIFFYHYNNQLYSKCIKPKYFPVKSQNHVNEFVLSIPTSIKFMSKDLLDIPVENFDLLYHQIKTINGDNFMDLCRHQIVGE